MSETSSHLIRRGIVPLTFFLISFFWGQLFLGEHLGIFQSTFPHFELPHTGLLQAQDETSSQGAKKSSTVVESVQNTGKDEQNVLARAQQLLDENRLDEALEFAKRAEEAFPGKVDTWITLGKIYLEQGTSIKLSMGFADLFRRDLFGAAEENFRKALAMDPGCTDARNHLSFTLFLLNNIPAAVDEARKTLSKHPDNAYAHYILGKAGMEFGELPDAVEHFKKAIACDGELIDARAGLIQALVARGERGQATQEVIQLIKMKPELPELLTLAISIYEPVELFKDAMAFYRILLEVAPERAEIRFRLGRVLYRLERFEEAEAVFDEILQADPEHEGALYQKGYLRLKEGIHDEAYLLLKRALVKQGWYFSSVVNHLQYLVQMKARDNDFEAALDIMDSILENDPYNTLVMADRALTLSNWGRMKEADSAYERLIEMAPWDSSFINDYALHLMGSQRIDEGLARLGQAVELDGNLDSLENLGAYHYFIMEDPEKADAYLAEVLKSDPERTKSLILRESIRLKTSPGKN